MAIHKLLEAADNQLRSSAVITYIDLVAAFDSVLHSYLLHSLRSFGVLLKYCCMVRAIYPSASVRIRTLEIEGHRRYLHNNGGDGRVVKKSDF